MRVPGHKLTVESSNERSRAEHSATGTCICGWEESASSQKVVRQEYRYHLSQAQNRQQSIRHMLARG